MQGRTQGLTTRGALRLLARNLLMWLVVFQICSSRISAGALMRSGYWGIVIENVVGAVKAQERRNQGPQATSYW